MLFISYEQHVCILKNNSKNSKTNQLMLIAIALNVCIKFIIYVICYKDIITDPILCVMSSCI